MNMDTHKPQSIETMDHHHPDPTTIESPQNPPPTNTYYSLPYNDALFLLYTTTTSLVLGLLTGKFLSAKLWFPWIAYAVSCLVCILINPELCVERRCADEDGNTVTVRRPLVGFKCCEAVLDLDRVRRGDYDAEDDYYTDPRFRDGYRYGRALLRI